MSTKLASEKLSDRINIGQSESVPNNTEKHWHDVELPFEDRTNKKPQSSIQNACANLKQGNIRQNWARNKVSLVEGWRALLCPSEASVLNRHSRAICGEKRIYHMATWRRNQKRTFAGRPLFLGGLLKVICVQKFIDSLQRHVSLKVKKWGFVRWMWSTSRRLPRVKSTRRTGDWARQEDERTDKRFTSF